MGANVAWLKIATVMGCIVVSDVAAAATLEQLQDIDRNRNNALDAGPEFRAYLKLEKLDGSEPLKAASLAKVGALQADIAQRGSIPFDELAEKKPVKITGCDRQTGVYIRRDKTDISIYTQQVGKAQAKGAAFGYTNDHQSGVQTGEVHGVAAFVFARNPCAKPREGANPKAAYISGYALATSLGADGNFRSDRRSEKSAFKPGFDAQVELANMPIFALNVLTASTYYQTDFRGHASAYGLSGSWEPYEPPLRLGGNPGIPLSPWFDYFWQAKAEVYALRVNSAGLTNLTAGTDYLWLGGTARLNTFLLDNLLPSGLSFVASYQWYWNERGHQTINLTTAGLSYNITPDGSTAIGLEYQYGTDRDTLDRRNQYMLTLSYKQ